MKYPFNVGNTVNHPFWRPIASSHLEKIAGCPMDDELSQPVEDELLQVPGDMVGAQWWEGRPSSFPQLGEVPRFFKV